MEPTTTRFGGVTIKPPADKASWCGSLEAVEVLTDVGDGEWIEDYWSPLWLAMELGDAEAFGQLLAVYCAAPVWGHAAPVTNASIVVTAPPESEAESVVTALHPCVTAAAANPEAEAFLAAALEPRLAALQLTKAPFGLSAELLEPLEPAERQNLASVVKRLPLGVALVSRDSSLAPSAGVGALPTHVDLLLALADSLDGDATDDAFLAACDASAASHEVTGGAVRIADVVGVRAVLLAGVQAPLARLTPAMSTSAFAYAMAHASAQETVTGAVLDAALEALLRMEARAPWFTAPAPASVHTAASENRIPGTAKIPATRPAALLTLLQRADERPACAAAWAACFDRMGAEAFSAAWQAGPSPADVDIEDEAACARHAAREALRGVITELRKLAEPSPTGTGTADEASAADPTALPLEARFQRAVDGFAKVAGEHPDPVKLEFYGLFKQATVGDVRGSRPWAIEFAARAKYDAWASRKGMQKDDAMRRYAERFESL